MEDLKLKAITAEMNILSRSDGSVIISQGDSSCIVDVNGPIEVNSAANIDMNKAYVDVLYRPKCGIPGVNERYKEKTIKGLCESIILTTLYPKTQINFQIQEMDDSSGIFACAINGCNIGLLNSGLEMKFNMAAVHCVLDETDEIIIDPDCIEEETLAFTRVQKPKRISGKYKADFTFVFESLKDSLISVHTNGSFSLQKYNEALKLSRQACRKIFDFYADLVKKCSVVYIKNSILEYI
ncbi:hypothetical protein PVAND_002020 [Polypedilum vanderplanki]|uniref:Exoribonuclease phosphorolytic domain-containing protein n=1 Tax=Polypedilum vanderplanki TaxID=319348 RepID=A0A9J6BR42_POLVA|nr:hypothetical protein PVAND_002020 [Polypedilum vanderplanki]